MNSLLMVGGKMPMRESGLKAAALNHMLGCGLIQRGTTIANEFVVDGMKRRTDLAIMGETSIAIEIKSEADTLRRLDGQLSSYGRFFDASILVTSSRHHSKVEEAVPKKVGLWIVDENGNITQTRKFSACRVRNKKALVKMLTAADLYSILRDVMPVGARRRELDERAVKLRVSDLRLAIREKFLRNYSGSSALFWSEVGEGAITADHVPMLSRFSSRREKLKLGKKAREHFWIEWSAQAEQKLISLMSQKSAT